MAQILSFRTPELRNDCVASRRQDHCAEVIIFPGVRYERWGDADASAGADKSVTTRDVIELAD